MSAWAGGICPPVKCPKQDTQRGQRIAAPAGAIGATRRMISRFSEARYLIPRPPPEIMFLQQTHLQRPLGKDFSTALAQIPHNPRARYRGDRCVRCSDHDVPVDLGSDRTASPKRLDSPTVSTA